MTKNLTRVKRRVIDGLIADNPGQAAQYAANPKVIGWFVGQVMKATRGQANPSVVNELLRTKLEGRGGGK